MANDRSGGWTNNPKMLEDELLKWRLKCGSREALSRIYEKYLNTLLTLAMALLNDVNAAEDVVHDVFISFAKSPETFRLHGSLKSYLTTCVVNRARDRIRTNQRRAVGLSQLNSTVAEPGGPERLVICNEESVRLNHAIAQLPPEQREVIILHLILQRNVGSRS